MSPLTGAGAWAAEVLLVAALSRSRAGAGVGAERRIGARRFSGFAGRAWTLCALAAVAPLFLEPFVRLFE